MLLVADVEARKVSLTTVRVQGDDDLILFYSLSLFSFMPSQQDWFIMFNLMQFVPQVWADEDYSGDWICVQT